MTTIHLVLPSLALTLVSFRVSSAIRCYSCASSEYNKLFQDNVAVQEQKERPKMLGPYCDTHKHLNTNNDLLVQCPRDHTCVTVFEMEFVGGFIDPDQPYRFLRGCARAVLDSKTATSDDSGGSGRNQRRRATNRPVEVAYLKRRAHCTRLPISEIWPTPASSPKADSSLRVCSCSHDGCNTHEQPVNEAMAIIRYDCWSIFAGIVVSLLAVMRGANDA